MREAARHRCGMGAGSTAFSSPAYQQARSRARQRSGDKQSLASGPAPSLTPVRPWPARASPRCDSSSPRRLESSSDDRARRPRFEIKPLSSEACHRRCTLADSVQNATDLSDKVGYRAWVRRLSRIRAVLGLDAVACRGKTARKRRFGRSGAAQTPDVAAEFTWRMRRDARSAVGCSSAIGLATRAFGMRHSCLGSSARMGTFCAPEDTADAAADARTLAVG